MCKIIHIHKKVYIFSNINSDMICKCITKLHSQNTNYTLLTHIQVCTCSCHTVQIHSEFCCTPPPGCSAVWDDLNCWPHAEVGETVSRPCPSFLRVKGLVHPGFSQTSVPEFNSIKPVKKKKKVRQKSFKE